MQEFILGFPKKSNEVRRFSSMQDAGNACEEFASIHADSEDKAKDKFRELYGRAFAPNEITVNMGFDLPADLLARGAEFHPTNKNAD